jgi:hypothetical protein
MTEPTGTLPFTYKELVTLMLRERGITKGIWGLYVKFGIAGANLGDAPGTVVPTAMVPILEVGLQPFKEVISLSVDAATLGDGAQAGPVHSGGATTSSPP